MSSTAPAAEPTQHADTDADTDVVVVGCGPTGATAAIMLAQRGLRVTVLERWPDPYPLPRAVHFDDEVYRIFADLGIAQDLPEISRPAPGMQLVDPQLRVLATFHRDPDGGKFGFPQANMFDQPDLERVLRARMTQLPGIILTTGVDVTGLTHPTRRHSEPRPNEGAREQSVAPGDGAITAGLTTVHYRHMVTGERATIRARAVLGCDGANSAVREFIGAHLHNLGFEQRWMVIDAISPEPLGAYDGVQQVCDHDRAATFMMVTPGRYRWEMRLRPDEQPDELTDDVVLDLVRPWLGTADADKLTLLRRAWYTFRGAVADHWTHQRVFLLGDAAHLTPPFIGQGMCAGIRDAANLAWKLALVLDGRAEERLLTSYEAERRPYAQGLIKLAIGVGWVMTGGTARTAPTRRVLLRTLTRLPGAEDKIVNLALPTFPRGPLTSEHAAAGQLIPRPTITISDARVPLDTALGTGFAVVTRGPAHLDCYEPELRDWFNQLGTTIVELSHDDDCGALGELLETTGARALLVRPDRVIAAAATDRPDLRRWRTMLSSAGVTPRSPTPRPTSCTATSTEHAAPGHI